MIYQSDGSPCDTAAGTAAGSHRLALPCMTHIVSRPTFDKYWLCKIPLRFLYYIMQRHVSHCNVVGLIRPQVAERSESRVVGRLY